MADVQKEKGYIQVANELNRQIIKLPLPGATLRVLLFIIDKTYGWHKTEECIPYCQFIREIGLSKRMVIYAVQELSAKNLIFVDPNGKTPEGKKCNKFKVNKDYDTWQVKCFAPQLQEVRRKAKKRISTLRKKKLENNEDLSTGAKHCKSPVQNFAPSKDSKDNNIINNIYNIYGAKNKNEISQESVPIELDENSSDGEILKGEVLEVPKIPRGSPPTNKQFGNEQINNMLNLLKAQLQVEGFCDSYEWQRKRAKHFISLFNRIQINEFMRRIELYLQDDFNYKKRNNLAWVYSQLNGWAEPKSSNNYGKLS